MAFISKILVMLAVGTVAFAKPTLKHKREGQAATPSASSPLDSFANIPQQFGANSPLPYEQYLQQIQGAFPAGNFPAVGSFPAFGQSGTRKTRQESSAANSANPLGSFANIPQQFGANSPLPYEQYLQQIQGAFPAGNFPAVGSFPAFGQSSTRKTRQESSAANSANPLGAFANFPDQFGANSPLSYEQYIQQIQQLQGAIPAGNFPAVGSFPSLGQSSTRKKRQESSAANSANPLGSFANIPQQFGANSPLPYEQYLQQIQGAFPAGNFPAVGSFPAFGQSSTRKTRQESSAANSANPLGAFANFPEQFGANSPLSYEQYIQQIQQLQGAIPAGNFPAVGSFPSLGQSSTRYVREDSAAENPASSNPFAGLTEFGNSPFTAEQIEQYMPYFQQFSGSFPTGNFPSLSTANA